mmetsp:Transcript_126718/g.370290  ORF Transcript_126718/g.370290 Transcript_126718/m.370290 type:complete len:203 (+) Transcript_126718:504-1112(+)
MVAGQILSVVVNTKAMREVTLPLPCVGAAVRVHEAAPALGAVFAPLALVHGAVLPHLSAIAVTLVSHPLASVHGTRRKDVGRPAFLLAPAIVGGQPRQLLQLLSEVAAQGQVLVLGLSGNLVFGRAVRRMSVVTVLAIVSESVIDHAVCFVRRHVEVRVPLVRGQAVHVRLGELLPIPVLLAALLCTSAGGACTHVRSSRML